jgi:hypothetical protein
VDVDQGFRASGDRPAAVQLPGLADLRLRVAAGRAALGSDGWRSGLASGARGLDDLSWCSIGFVLASEFFFCTIYHLVDRDTARSMSFKVHSNIGDLALGRNCFLVWKQYGGDNEKVDDRGCPTPQRAHVVAVLC